MPVAYVAGPYRDARGSYYVEHNIRVAEGVAAWLWGHGYAVLCPHANTRHFDGLCSEEVFLAGTLALMERCDVVVMVAGWRRSAGATAERARAMALGIPVLDACSDEDLAALIAHSWRAPADGEEVSHV
jgi:nucleoside 2-deoxyribosyltransferase